MTLAAGLRYGENPHQPAAFYTDRSASGVGATQSDHCRVAPLRVLLQNTAEVKDRAQCFL